MEKPSEETIKYFTQKVIPAMKQEEPDEILELIGEESNNQEIQIINYCLSSFLRVKKEDMTGIKEVISNMVQI